MKRVVYNNKSFKILNEYSFTFSNNEVTFNDIKIDFTNCTLLDIPYKYQEIKIMDIENEETLEGKVLFTGYLDEINLSEMKMQKEFREITLTLLSPLKMATKRNVSLIGTYSLRNAIERILQPLIDDGFIIKEFNITDGQITTNFVLESIEFCMNNIGFKRNIMWFIDENKQIYINSIDYLFGLSVKRRISYKNNELGLLKIQPKIENVDYANIINFKNIRLIYSANQGQDEPYPITTLNKKVKKGDIIDFDNPVVVDETILRNRIDKEGKTYFSLLLGFDTENGSYKTYSIGINTDKDSTEYDQFVIRGFSFSTDQEESEIVLQKDEFFSNLFTGFKWNGENATLTVIKSDTALRYTTMRFMYSPEINKMKGIISKTGQVEKPFDFKNKWITLDELIIYARSLMIQNTNIVNQVILKYDINPELRIGDTVSIDEPNFYIQGTFAVKQIRYTYVTEEKQIWELTLKSSDLISSYIDLFRPIETEQNRESIDTVILSEFVEERINEIHSIELDNKDYTLNFVLGG